jgi:hypothetical protein
MPLQRWAEMVTREVRERLFDMREVCRTFPVT